VLSESTRRIDRAVKMPIYARHGLKYLWLVDPLAQTLEVFELDGSRWTLQVTHSGDEKIRAIPFDAIELDLAPLWDTGTAPAGPEPPP
jgi:Uma2 family endonuclease